MFRFRRPAVQINYFLSFTSARKLPALLPDYTHYNVTDCLFLLRAGRYAFLKYGASRTLRTMSRHVCFTIEHISVVSGLLCETY